MNIVTRKFSELTASPGNPRIHSPEQLAVLVDSLRLHGQPKPAVITPDNVILAGHQLVAAFLPYDGKVERYDEQMTAQVGVDVARANRGVCCNARRQVLDDFTGDAPRGLLFLPTPLLWTCANKCGGKI
jgi:hypothetical protein